jgi:HlyD family secretion protein
MKKILSRFALFFLFVLTAGVFSACAGATKVEPTAEIAGTPVKASGGPVAEGSVIPVQNATLTFSIGGVVENIFISEGAAVKKGDVIARLKGSERLQASVTAAELELISAQQNLDKLNEEADKVKAEVELRVAKAKDMLDSATDKLEWKSFQRGTDWHINVAQAEVILAQDIVKRIEEDYAGVTNLGEEDLNRAAILTQLSAARKRYDKATGNLDYLEQLPDEIELGIAQAEFDVATQELELANIQLAKVKNGPDPDAVALAEARLNNAKTQLNAGKAAISDLELTAPFQGVVVTNGLKLGELASPGQTSVVIADLSEYKIETTDLTELNVVSIKEGSKVSVTFDAVPGLEISGIVERTQALGKNVQGDITYQVTVKLDQQDERLRWNMTALVAFAEE